MKRISMLWAILVLLTSATVWYYLKLNPGQPDAALMKPMDWSVAEVAGCKLSLCDAETVAEYTFGRNGLCRVTRGKRGSALMGASCIWKISAGKIQVLSEPPAHFAIELTLLKRENGQVVVRDGEGGVHAYRLSENR